MMRPSGPLDGRGGVTRPARWLPDPSAKARDEIPPPPPPQVQIRQAEHREGPSQVLSQPAIPHHREAPQALDDQDGGLPSGAAARSALVDPAFVVRQRRVPRAPLVHPIPAPRQRPLHPIVRLPVRLVRIRIPLLPGRKAGSCVMSAVFAFVAVT